jgi:2-isopropylmalate synthase
MGTEVAPSTGKPEDRVKIFDTTLRDGEQSPGISLNAAEKLEIAQQLSRLGVDVIEAGFPITSPGDFEAVQTIARNVQGPVICALARSSFQDIDAAWNAIKDSERPRIHTFLATSDLHIKYKLQTSREDVKGQVKAAVAHAKSYTDDVEYSPEDGSRSDIDFMAEVIQIAIDEGATTINVPDTTGYAIPNEYADMFTALYDRVPDLRNVTVSVHCHDDLGLAVANSFAGVMAGARQVEGAINGIGERAGNTSLEEFIMLLRTRSEKIGGLWTGANTQEIARTSRLVSRMTGYAVQPNKAIIGRNAFAHEAGIHQDGVLKNPQTYEIMEASTVGVTGNNLVLGKHSGRHALKNALNDLGYEIDGERLNQAFKAFKEIADRKKEVNAMDLEAIVNDEMRDDSKAWIFEGFELHSASEGQPTATVKMTNPAGEQVEGKGSGNGTIEALFDAINDVVGLKPVLNEYRVQSVTSGPDSIGEVSVIIEIDGREAAGQGVATDTVWASGRAYARALTNAERRRGVVSEAESAARSAANNPVAP